MDALVKRQRTCAGGMILQDLSKLCDRAQEEEMNGKHVTSDCKIVVNGITFYAHLSLLVARSEFFLKAFAHPMSEVVDKTVELKHVGLDVSKDAVHVLLRFIYTGDPPEMSVDTSEGVLKLIGVSDDTGGFLGLSDCDVLRDACFNNILSHVTHTNMIDMLLRVHQLGPSAAGLQKTLLENIVFRLAECSADAQFAKIQSSPQLMLAMLSMISECTVTKPNWRPCIELKGRLLGPWAITCSYPYTGLDNSYEALNNPDMTVGAGACRDEEYPSIRASFEHPVRVRSVHLGIADMGDGWSRHDLHNAEIQYDAGDGWVQATRVEIPSESEIHCHRLLQPISASDWRVFGNKFYLGISFLRFES